MERHAFPYTRAVQHLHFQIISPDKRGYPQPTAHSEKSFENVLRASEQRMNAQKPLMPENE
jgi:hypothetical protein